MVQVQLLDEEDDELDEDDELEELLDEDELDEELLEELLDELLADGALSAHCVAVSPTLP